MFLGSSRIKSAVVGVSALSTVSRDVSEGTCIPSSALLVLLFVSTKFVTVSVSSSAYISKSRRQSRSGIVSNS